MPRNRPVDYPQVHPPTAQAYPGLAPPPNIFTDQPRFSWQDSAPETISPSHAAEKELEAGLSGAKQEHRKSIVPPLPVLPEHLSGTTLQDGGYQSSTLEKQEYSVSGENESAPQVQSGTPQQYYQQQQFLPPQQQARQFRPDVPRNIQQPESQIQQQQQQQQQQPGLESQPLGPPLSYEASQAQIVSQQYYTQPRMQEQPVYPGHHNVSSSRLSAHALPMHNDYLQTTANHHPSRLENGELQPAQVNGPTRANHVLHPTQTALRVDLRAQNSQPVPIHIGPDTNPLTPTSPTPALTSPTRYRNPSSPKNKNHKNTTTTTNNDDNNDPPVSFPQATSYTPPGPTRGGTWQTSLFSCSNPTVCLPSLTCPCIIYGRTQYRLSQKSAKKDPTNMLGYSVVNGSCLAWSVLCGVNVLLTAIQHTRVRKMYEMDEGSGSVGSDFAKSVCCCCCVVAQDEKEVKWREEGSGGRMVDSGYKRNEEMMYSPPPR